MKRALIFRWLAFALPSLLPLTALPQQSTLTLRQAIDQALGQNPQITLADADMDAARAGLSLAHSAWLPQLHAVEDISRGDDPVYVFGSRLRQQRFTQSNFSLNSLNRPTPLGNYASRLTGQWMLFNGFSTQRQTRAAKLGVSSATYAKDAASQAVMFQVVQAYQAVLYAQRQAAVAQHQQQTADALLQDAQTRVHAGLAVDSDLLAAQVNDSARKQEAISAEGNLQTAWAELAAAMGALNATQPSLEPLRARSYPAEDLAADIAAALKTRPDLKALARQNAAARQAVKAARGDFFPTLSAYGNLETDRPSFAGAGGNNWVAGAQLSLDILPLGKRAHLAQARAAQEKAAAEQRAQELAIRLAVSRAYAAQQSAQQSLATSQAAMRQATESLRILRNRYNAGLATMTDLLRGEDALRQSETNYWQAVYGNTVAYASLLYATGRLTPDSAETLQ